jgi:hypothetical protein
MNTHILLLSALTLLFNYEQDKQPSQTGTSIVASQPVSAEYIRKAIAFIKQVKSSELTNSKFILVSDAVSLNSNDCLQNALADKQFYSSSEKQLIENRAASWQYQWKKTDFSVSKLVKQDTINLIFKTHSKRWDYFNKYVGRDFNEFSLPIFIRNDTYCLFYSANYCGNLCGGGSLVLYKKEKGNWIPVKSYCDWES